MNIFIIPSSYPTINNHISGVFYKEQAMSLAESGKLKVAVSIFGRYSFHISKKLLSNVSLLRNFLKSKKEIINPAENYFEFINPTLTWTWRFFEGNLNGIVKSHEINFLKAVDEFGKIDLIHAHVGHPAGYAAMLISQKYNIPYIITEHMGPFPFPNLVENGKLVKHLSDPMRNAGIIICVSPALEKAVNDFGFHNTVYIPNLIDEEKFFPVKNKNSVFTFFTLAAMVDDKGIPELLKSIVEVKKVLPDVIFKIAGDGQSLESYMKFADENDISGNIKWLGRITREKAIQEYQSSNAFILASRHESFGVVFIEALACGKPVIATRCGGPDIIVNKNNGILVPVGDVVEIKNAILYIVKNRNKYKSSIIRNDFIKRFSKKAVVKQIVNVYKNIVIKNKAV